MQEMRWEQRSLLPAPCPQFVLDLAEVGGRTMFLRHRAGTWLPSLYSAAWVDRLHRSRALGIVLVFGRKEKSTSRGITSRLPRDGSQDGFS